MFTLPFGASHGDPCNARDQRDESIVNVQRDSVNTFRRVQRCLAGRASRWAAFQQVSGEEKRTASAPIIVCDDNRAACLQLVAHTAQLSYALPALYPFTYA